MQNNPKDTFDAESSTRLSAPGYWSDREATERTWSSVVHSSPGVLV